jgi:hypothetical protein
MKSTRRGFLGGPLAVPATAAIAIMNTHTPGLRATSSMAARGPLALAFRAGT